MKVILFLLLISALSFAEDITAKRAFKLTKIAYEQREINEKNQYDKCIKKSQLQIRHRINQSIREGYFEIITPYISCGNLSTTSTETSYMILKPFYEAGYKIEYFSDHLDQFRINWYIK